jgi:long-chain acyl-CoA synthetase
MEYRSPLDLLYQWEQNCPDKIYLRQPINDVWKTWTWKETGNEVRRMAAALVHMNLPPQSHIALISKNCAHWILCDLAIMMSGHVSIPLYPNLTAGTLKQILEHSDSVLLFVGKLDNWEVMKPGVPEGMKCISFPFYPHAEYENWYDLLKKFEPLQENVKRAKEETGTIIYTSGTTGIPKGVVHRFNSFSFPALEAIPWLDFSTSSRFFSYLPLSHSAERSLVEMGSIYSGGTVYFSESVARFPENLSTAKPTEFLAVHHIWKIFQQRILEKIPQRRLDLLLRLPLVSTWLKKKIKREIGLQCARNIIAGASPTPIDLIEWFASLDIRIQEAYGLTENWSYSHINRRDHIRPGFVGQPFPGVAVRLGADEEILVKHEALMSAYYKEPEKTAQAFTQDGFLRTGDSGFIDNENFLKITGRIKDLFKTGKGNYVAPSPIEEKLAANSNIEFICVVGNQLPQPMALVVLSEIGNTLTQPDLIAALAKNLQELNPTLDAYERLSKIVVIGEEWTVENNILTPTFKIKRNEVEKKYAPYYQQWLQSDGAVIFS